MVVMNLFLPSPVHILFFTFGQPSSHPQWKISMFFPNRIFFQIRKILDGLATDVDHGIREIQLLNGRIIAQPTFHDSLYSLSHVVDFASVDYIVQRFSVFGVNVPVR